MPARTPFALLVLPLALLLTGCGDDTAAKSASGSVAIKAGDSTCEVATTSFAPGSIRFDVQNTGKDTTEVYVYAKGSGGDFDKVVGEVENIAPGTSRDFKVKVTGGTYKVACKPGQKGDGIRTDLTVSGPAATAPVGVTKVQVKAHDFGFTGLETLSPKVGDKIEFELENQSTATQHELEFLGPDGTNIGEVGPTKPGADGEVIIEFAKAGTYTYMCGLDDHASKGMKRTFTVS